MLILSEIFKAFSNWINEKEKRKQRYGNVLKDMNDAYIVLNEINPTKVYFFESIYSVGLNKFIIKHRRLYNAITAEEPNQEAIEALVTDLKGGAEKFFETFNANTEEKIISSMLDMFYTNVPAQQRPDKMEELAKTYDGRWNELVRKSMKASVFTEQQRYLEFLENPTKTVMEDEALFMLNHSLLMKYLDITNSSKAILAQEKLNRANRLFIEALRLMNPKKNYCPNANSTLRLSYGSVLPYTNKEGKQYQHYTTMKGLMAKEDPNNTEFIVPGKLKELYENKDYGRYGKDGELRVNFISNNDITGGNSGSPVLNSRGELIGCAFDGNWEAMSGDIDFEEEMQRTISVDIRYVLFVIDKYAGASHLIDEMTIVE